MCVFLVCPRVCMSIGSFACAHMCKALTGVCEVCTLIHTRVCLCACLQTCVSLWTMCTATWAHVSTQVWCVCTCFHNDVCPDGSLPSACPGEFLCSA